MLQTDLLKILYTASRLVLKQEIELTSKDNSNGNAVKLEWDALADGPGTSSYVASRGGRFDELHVVVIDDKGDITGNAGTILEKHVNLSKAKMVNIQLVQHHTGESI